jgi:hypothetical protein
MIKKIKNNFLYKWISDIIDKYHILNKYRKYGHFRSRLDEFVKPYCYNIKNFLKVVRIGLSKPYRKDIIKEYPLSMPVDSLYYINMNYKHSDKLNNEVHVSVELPKINFLKRIKIFIKKLLHIKTKYHIR